jgi:hypothetical protein
MTTMRRAVMVVLAGAAGLGAGAGLGSGVHTVRAAVSLGVANGTVTAGADHVALGSGVFPNFKSGAIDSWIPLAHAHVDNSPFAEGTASPLDTGPLGATGAGAASKPQPQTATMAGGAPAPAPQSAYRQAQLAALDAALQTWRARFLTPTEALRHPAVHPDAAEPDGVAGGTAIASVSVDPATGLVDSGDARVGSASFGGGSVLIRGLHVSVAVTNAGTPHQTSTVDLGQVSVGGMPVSVGSGGVSLVNGAVVPIDQLQQATEQLNTALAKGGLTLRAVAPTVTSSGNQVTVVATGIHVDVLQPPTAPGVPTQFAEHSLGEVFADSLAVPAAPLPELLPLLPLTPPAALAAAGGQSATAGESAGVSSSSGLGGGTAYPSAPPATSHGAAATRGAAPSMVATGVVREKPLWLLLLYFMWQALLIGTAVSLWWWRAAARAAS